MVVRLRWLPYWDSQVSINAKPRLSGEHYNANLESNVHLSYKVIQDACLSYVSVLNRFSKSILGWSKFDSNHELIVKQRGT